MKGSIKIKLGDAYNLRELLKLLEAFSLNCPIIGDSHKCLTVSYGIDNGYGFLQIGEGNDFNIIKEA